MSDVAVFHANIVPAAAARGENTTLANLTTFVMEQSALVRRALDLPLFFGINQSYIRQLVEEYCKFLFLKAHAKDSNAKWLSASEQIDAIWRLHLIDTKSYATVSKNFLGMSFIHYDPNRLDAEEDRKRLDTTRMLYFQVFGRMAPPFFWGPLSAHIDTFTASNILSYEREITIDCGHIDCTCEPQVSHSHLFTLSREAYTDLFWSDHAREDKPSAKRASDAVVESMLELLQASPHGESFSRILLDRVQMFSRHVFFTRDALPNYIDALEECPNHCVGMGHSHSQPFRISVKFANSTTEILDVLSSFSILHVKVIIRRISSIPVEQQRLICAGKELEMPKLLLPVAFQARVKRLFTLFVPPLPRRLFLKEWVFSFCV